MNIHEEGSDFSELLRDFQQVSQEVESRAREKERKRLKKETEAEERRKAEEALSRKLQTQVQARESGPVSSRSGQVVDRWLIRVDVSPSGCSSAEGWSGNWPDPEYETREVSKETYDRLRKEAAARAARIEANPGNCCK